METIDDLTKEHKKIRMEKYEKECWFHKWKYDGTECRTCVKCRKYQTREGNYGPEGLDSYSWRTCSHEYYNKRVEDIKIAIKQEIIKIKHPKVKSR